MSTQAAVINSLLQYIRSIDPGLADVLLKMAEEIDRLATVVDPPPVVAKRIEKIVIPVPPNVLEASYELTRTNVIIRWVPPTTGFLLYEVRRGDTWETATRLLSTGTNLVLLDPTPVGTTRFLIKGINISGVASEAAAVVDVVVPPLGTFAVTAIAIGNAVTLTWTIPASVFAINFFTVYRDNSPISAQLRGTFFAIQENRGGKITYGVEAEDIAGNKSPVVYTTVDVATPEDYEIQTTYVSDFSGTITNGKKEDGVIYYNVNTIEKISEHFDNNGFASPQAQVDAGYPLWIQPTRPTGSYDEQHDFLLPQTNTIIGIDWLFENIVPTFTFGTQIYYANAAGTWFGPFTTQTVFAAEVRWVRVIFTFSGNDFKSLMMFKSFTISLYVKRENDGGNQILTAVPTGDLVYFKKPFKYIESITVTPETEVETYAVYDYDAVPNPQFFKVFMFNNTGARIGGPISWKARGIL
jgi:hypothetical protein